MTKAHSLEQALERIKTAEDGDSSNDDTSIRDVLEELGRRTFAPLLLLPGLLTLLPVGGIPGVPTIMGILVLVVSVQLLCGRKTFWLPSWLLDRSVSSAKLEKSRRWMLRPARFIDHLMRPRLTAIVNGGGIYVIAIFSIVVALMMPPMELVPFSAIGAGLALTLFGLALLADDGLVALLGMIAMSITLGLAGYSLL